jgi:hypothetical protein
LATLAANALISIDDYREAIGLSVGDPLDEDKARLAINAASQFLANYCNRKFIAPSSAEDEIFSGDNGQFYYVKHMRITGTPTLYYWDGDSWEELDSSYTWEVDDQGYYVFARDFVFWRGTRNWKINYVYGWSQADVPAPVKRVCVKLVQRLLMAVEGKEGITNISAANTSTSHNLADGMTSEMLLLIAPYRRLSIG